MKIDPTGPGNIIYGNVKDAPGVGGPKQPFPAKPTTETSATGSTHSTEFQKLAGLGKIDDLNDPEKTKAIVRGALTQICEPQFADLNQQEKDGVLDFMANDPLISGRTSKLMEKVFRGD